MSKELRIIFLGTPDFAAASLEALISAGKNIVAVITAPDKPKGRGKRIGQSAVKELALEHQIPVLQPKNLKAPEFIDELSSYQADLQIVVAFRMLPEMVWNMPPLGTFNLHASLLPQYRGAAPINWAIINGETETGVTTFFLKHEIDTGAIIFQEEETISEEDTVGDLYGRLMNKGAQLVVKTVDAIEKEDYPQVPQKIEGDLKAAPKIFKEDCKIDWNQPTEQIRNFIRGLSPYPAAWTMLDGKVLKVFRVSLWEGQIEPGIIKPNGKSSIIVGTGDGSLMLEELQIEGKKRMTSDAFLRGNNIADHTKLG